MNALGADFFDRDACHVAVDLLGKVLRHRVDGHWLSARIVETEAYYRAERGSHASLGETPSRRALFLPAGTIYMYYARGADSFNVSCAGPGDAVLFKAGVPWPDQHCDAAALALMHARNPRPGGGQRPAHRLCAGQTLLCRALDLRVGDWNARAFEPSRLLLDDCGLAPERVIQTRRLGIPRGRDEDLPYRFIDAGYAAACTRNPLRQRGLRAGRDYRWLDDAPAPGPARA